MAHSRIAKLVTQLENEAKQIDAIDPSYRENATLSSSSAPPGLKQKIYERFEEARKSYANIFIESGETEGVLKNLEKRIQKRIQKCDDEVKEVLSKIEKKSEEAATVWINSQKTPILAEAAASSQKLLRLGLELVEVYSQTIKSKPAGELTPSEQKIRNMITRIQEWQKKLSATGVPEAYQRQWNAKLNTEVTELIESVDELYETEQITENSRLEQLLDAITAEQQRYQERMHASTLFPETPASIRERQWRLQVSLRTLTDKDQRFLYKKWLERNPQGAYQTPWPSILHEGASYNFVDTRNIAISARELYAWHAVFALHQGMEIDEEYVNEWKKRNKKTIPDEKLREEVLEASEEQLISTLMDCRREHNEGMIADWKHLDNPSCPPGHEGRIMLKASAFNKIMSLPVATKPFKKVPKQTDSYILEQFQELNLDKQKQIAIYFRDKWMDLKDEKEIDPASKMAFQEFVSSLKTDAEKFFTFLRRNEPELSDTVSVGGGAPRGPGARRPRYRMFTRRPLMQQQVLDEKIKPKLKDILEITSDSLLTDEINAGLLMRFSSLSTNLLITDEKQKTLNNLFSLYLTELMDLERSVATLRRTTEEKSIRALLSPSYRDSELVRFEITDNKAMLEEEYKPRFDTLEMQLRAELAAFNASLEGRIEEEEVKKIQIDIDKTVASFKERGKRNYIAVDTLIHDTLGKQRNLENFMKLKDGKEVKDTEITSAVNAMLSPTGGLTPLPLPPLEFNATYAPDPKQWALQLFRLAMTKDQNGELSLDTYDLRRSITIMLDDLENFDEVLIRLNTYLEDYKQYDEENAVLSRETVKSVFAEYRLNLDDPLFDPKEVIPLDAFVAEYFSDTDPRQASEKKAAENIPFDGKTGKFNSEWLKCAEHWFQQPMKPANVEKIYRFALLTLFKQLGIDSIRRQDARNIRQLCDLYLRQGPSARSPLPFYPEETINAATILQGFAAHLSRMVATLKPVKTLFANGDIQLLSSGEAKLALQSAAETDETKKDAFVLRLANRDPNKIYLTWCQTGVDGTINVALPDACFEETKETDQQKLREGFIEIARSKMMAMADEVVEGDEPNTIEPAFPDLHEIKEAGQQPSFKVSLGGAVNLVYAMSTEFAQQLEQKFVDRSRNVKEEEKKNEQNPRTSRQRYRFATRSVTQLIAIDRDKKSKSSAAGVFKASISAPIILNSSPTDQPSSSVPRLGSEEKKT